MTVQSLKTIKDRNLVNEHSKNSQYADNEIVSIRLADEIKQICQPLEKLNIHLFIYQKIDIHNGQQVFLSNNSKLIEHLFFRDCSNDSPSMTSIDGEGIYFGCHVHCPETLQEIKIHFNIENIFTIVEKSKNNNVEFFTYGTHCGENSAINVYLNKTYLLRQFNRYFIDLASSAIANSTRKPIHFEPQKENEYPDINTSIQDFENQISGKERDKEANGKLNLSDKEFMCCKLMVQGYSSKHIAKHLNLSHRTVETYIVRARDKLAIQSKVEMYRLFQNNNFLTSTKNS